MVPGAPIHDPIVCPGYSTNLPMVEAVARAWGWWNKGQFFERYPDAPEVLMDLVELFNQERAAAHEHELEKRSK